MALRATTYRIGDASADDGTLRIGTVRFLPRGVPKREFRRRGLFDVWLPLLAPSRELLKDFKAGRKSARAFFRAYRAEMSRPDVRHAIELIASVALRMPVAIGCYCEDETRCHRSVLIELIRDAAGLHR